MLCFAPHCRPSWQAAIVAAALGWGLVADAAQGAIYVLKSGGRVEGESLNPQRTAGEPYLVQTPAGVKLALPEGLVARVVVRSDLSRQYEALVQSTPQTVEGQWALAEWCKEMGLVSERKRHLHEVLALDPDHAEARKALGYQRFGSRWLTQDEYLQSQGYVRYNGAWRLRQEVEILTRQAQEELAIKQWRKDIRRWLDQVASGGRLAASAAQSLENIRDPLAAPALAELIADPKQPRAIRLKCLELLGKLPPGLATVPLLRVALEDSDARVQDACLEELKRGPIDVAVAGLVMQLKSPDNARVNRAAECLAALGDKSATLPLINALVTEHRFQINPNAGGGNMSLQFNSSGSGGTGPGGLTMGNKPIYVKKQLQNPSVLSALTSLHPGTNFRYNVEAWRQWYIQSQTSVPVDLRRGD